jgi:hypothetical protein
VFGRIGLHGYDINAIRRCGGAVAPIDRSHPTLVRREKRDANEFLFFPVSLTDKQPFQSLEVANAYNKQLVLRKIAV